MEMNLESLGFALSNPDFNARNFIYKVTGKPVSECEEEVEKFRTMVAESDLPDYLKVALDADVQRPAHAQMKAARERYIATLARTAPDPVSVPQQAQSLETIPEKVRKPRRTSDEMFQVHQEQEKKREINKQINDHIRIVIIKNYRAREYYRLKLPSELQAAVSESGFYQRWYNVPEEEKESIAAEAKKAAVEAAMKAAEEKRKQEEAEETEKKRIEDERIAAEEAARAEARAKKEEEAEINAKAFRKALHDIGALEKIEEIPRIKEYVSDIDLAMRRHVQINIESIKTDIDVLNAKMNAILNALNIPIPTTSEPISKESKMTPQEYYKREEDLPSWGEYQRSKNQQRR